MGVQGDLNTQSTPENKLNSLKSSKVSAGTSEYHRSFLFAAGWGTFVCIRMHSLGIVHACFGDAPGDAASTLTLVLTVLWTFDTRAVAVMSLLSDSRCCAGASLSYLVSFQVALTCPFPCTTSTASIVKDLGYHTVLDPDIL